MKKFLLLLLIPVLFCSCEPSQVRGGRKIYKAYFKHVLKDPSSLVIYRESYTLGDDEYEVNWELDYGAKNSYGGMVRSSIKFTTTSDIWIRVDPLYGGDSYSGRELGTR